MKAGRILCSAVMLVALVIAGGARDQHGGQGVPDPRVGLKAGLRDAGQAARNMELVATVFKPQGFFDPKTPAGEPTPAETPEPPAGQPPPPPAGRPPSMLNFANSDLAFSGNHLFIGNFNGFNVYDVQNPKKPKLVTSVVCPGGQGDMSVHGNLLVMSVEQTRGRIDCGTQGVEPTVSPERFRGVRVFDISDISKPKQVAAVQTCRGSHTHTLVTDPKDSANIYVYGSGTSTVRSGDELAGCSGKDPKEDPNTALFSIDVIQVPLAAPQTAKIVNRPRIFADPKTGAISGLWQGGTHGPGTQTSRVTNQCHDITVFPEVGLAAGACAGNGILLDMSDPVHPVRLDAVTDPNFAYWHSATFNNDGTKVVFTDEWGGGTRPRCRATDLPNWGADAIFDVVDRKLQFRGYFKMPAAQTEQENCVAHNGSLVPVPGRDIMVQGWYQGGVSVFDFTDSAHPIEIAFFDRGPVDATQLVTAGHWSAYWYNGYIYGAEIARGLDVFRLTPSEHLTKSELDAAMLVRPRELNVQDQTKIAWPSSPVVARAYLDQLTRSKAVDAARAAAIRSAIDGMGKSKTGADVAGQLESSAAQASGPDAARMRALAALLKP
jgi:LVIVD repeat-containing protein